MDMQSVLSLQAIELDESSIPMAEGSSSNSDHCSCHSYIGCGNREQE